MSHRSRRRQRDSPPLDGQPSLRTSALGREREFATFGCGRSVAICPVIGCHPRMTAVAKTLICSMSSANVRFQGGSVSRPENRHGLLWVPQWTLSSAGSAPESRGKVATPRVLILPLKVTRVDGRIQMAPPHSQLLLSTRRGSRAVISPLRFQTARGPREGE